jgi:hypothetical protein
MKLLKFLDQIWIGNIYAISLDSSHEEISLLETLEDDNYISKNQNYYKITLKGKLRLLYDFLFEKFNKIPGEGFFDDYYFEDYPEWFKEHHLNEDQYHNLKKKLITMGLIEKGANTSFRVLSLDFEECYDSFRNPVLTDIINHGNLIIGDHNLIEDENY